MWAAASSVEMGVVTRRWRFAGRVCCDGKGEKEELMIDKTHTSTNILNPSRTVDDARFLDPSVGLPPPNSSRKRGAGRPKPDLSFP